MTAVATIGFVTEAIENRWAGVMGSPAVPTPKDASRGSPPRPGHTNDSGGYAPAGNEVAEDGEGRGEATLVEPGLRKRRRQFTRVHRPMMTAAIRFGGRSSRSRPCFILRKSSERDVSGLPEIAIRRLEIRR